MYSSFNFRDRREAGQLLAAEIKKLPLPENILVLGLPRGGVPVAYEIANALNAPLDIFLVRKLGVPWNEELAMGAISLGTIVLLNEDVVWDSHLTKNQIEEVIEKEKKELQRRDNLYRKNKPPLTIQDKTIILVDDGVATGATMKVAIKALRKLACKKLIVAVPVSSPETAIEISPLVDEFICLMTPDFFMGIGQFYQDFSQLTDEEVIAFLS